MKKLSIISISAVIVSTFIAFAFSSCGAGKFSSPERQAKSIGPSDLPSSGAKTFVTTQAGASSALKELALSLTEDSYFPGMKKTFPKVKNEFLNMISGKYGDKEYFDSLKKTFSDISVYFTKSEENPNKTISETPGKAELSPEVYEVNIPSIYFSVRGIGKDINEKLNGSAFIKSPLFSADLNSFSFSINTSSSMYQTVNDAKSIVAAKLKLPGLLIDVPSLEVKMNQVTVNEKNSALKDSLDFDVNGIYYCEFNPEEVSKNSMIKKAILSGSFDIKPAGDGNFKNIKSYSSAKARIDLNAGISFVTKGNSGGKIILTGTVEQGNKDEKKAKKITSSQIANSFNGDKLTQEEFDRIGIPLQIYVNVSFYDDNDEKTLDFITFKNLYDFYCFIYDGLESGNYRNSVINGIEKLYAMTDDISNQKIYEGISSTMSRSDEFEESDDFYFDSIEE